MRPTPPPADPAEIEGVSARECHPSRPDDLSRSISSRSVTTAVPRPFSFPLASRNELTTPTKPSGSCQKSRWPSSGQITSWAPGIRPRAALRCAGRPRCQRRPAGPACVRGYAVAAAGRRSTRQRLPELTMLSGPPTGGAGVRRGGQRVLGDAERRCGQIGHSLAWRCSAASRLMPRVAAISRACLPALAGPAQTPAESSVNAAHTRA